jgi:hypothetical protein
VRKDHKNQGDALIHEIYSVINQLNIRFREYSLRPLWTFVSFCQFFSVKGLSEDEFLLDLRRQKQELKYKARLTAPESVRPHLTLMVIPPAKNDLIVDDQEPGIVTVILVN